MEEEKKERVSQQLIENDNSIDALSKGILGYGKAVDELISNTVPDVRLTHTSINKNQVIGADLFSISGKDKDSKYNLYERIYASLMEKTGVALELQSLLQSRQTLNAEMNYLINRMPEIQNAIDMLANDVVYPNAADMSGIKIEFFNNDESKSEETEPQLIKYFKPLDDPLQILNNKRIYNYNIDEDVLNVVQHLALYGHQIVATIPYKNIVQDLLYDKENGDISMEDKFYSSSSEAVNIISNKYKKKQTGFSESLNIDKLSSVVNKDINESIRHIYSHTPYSESDVEYVKYLINKEEASLFSPVAYTPKKIKGNISEILKPKGEANLNPVEMASLDKLRAKKQRKFNINNIVGCTHDVLDPSDTVPVYIKDEIIGVYVVENAMTQGIQLNGTMSNLINASNLSDGNSKLNDNYSDRVKDILFNDIRKVLSNNLDKNLLKNNPNLIEDIEFIIKFKSRFKYSNGGFNPQVKFIPAEFLTIHKIGNGPLGTPLLMKVKHYAHLYIQLMNSDMTSKVFFEKPRYLIKLPYNGDASNSARIMQSINTFRHAIPRLNDIGIPDVMNDSSASYHTVIVPLNKDDKPSFEVDALPTLEPRDNSEYLAKLRNQVTMTIGYPADIFDPSQQLDFAKKIANINGNTLIKILSLQKNLSVTMSELCTKRLKYMTGNSALEVKVTFESPSDITANVTKDMIDQKNTISDVYFALIDKDPRIRDEHREQVKQYINKKLLDGVVDQNLLEEAIVAVSTFQEGTRQIED